VVGTCEICGVTKKSVFRCEKGPFLCKTHKKQMRLYGKIKYYTTIPNTIIKYDNYAVIIIIDTLGKEVARTKIDLDDIPKVEGKKWTKDGRIPFYIRRREKIDGKYKTILLHRLIMDCVENSKLIDHKNLDTLDNRKSNLRFVSYSINNYNKGLRKTNTSGKTGVGFDKARNKWVAKLTLGEKQYSKGFKTKQDAIEERIKMELKYFGEVCPA